MYVFGFIAIQNLATQRLERLLTKLKLTTKSSLELQQRGVCVCFLNVKIIFKSLCFVVTCINLDFKSELCVIFVTVLGPDS